MIVRGGAVTLETGGVVLKGTVKGIGWVGWETIKGTGRGVKWSLGHLYNGAAAGAGKIGDLWSGIVEYTFSDLSDNMDRVWTSTLNWFKDEESRETFNKAYLQSKYGIDISDEFTAGTSLRRTKWWATSRSSWRL
eukprot:GHVU01009099.1.p2 GENE.GHVU01009099.1~~GHVU01009099.1.p2  ORF type:complete len:135 (-),score=13.60 GHVU01009099.1:1298-1702(-)